MKYDVFVTEHPTAGIGQGLATAEEAASWKYLATLGGPLAYAKGRATQLVNEGYYHNARVFSHGQTIGRLKFTVRS